MSDGWFVGVDPGDVEAAAERVREGRADAPADWPAEAVAADFAADAEQYYDQLHEATTSATRAAVQEQERADDRQLVHAIRSMDDCERTANELAERAAEWAGSLFDGVETGIEGARDVADRQPESPAEDRAISLAQRVADLADERDDLRTFVETQTPSIAPNLAEMAGPVLAARLIALAGGLETLAKKPSGTVQVLGAEDALFAHLSGRAPSPKHGAIFTHDYVRTIRPEDRGSAARAFAGKLSIAARIDHYRGEREPGIHDELRERIETIRAREEDDD